MFHGNRSQELARGEIDKNDRACLCGENNLRSCVNMSSINFVFRATLGFGLNANRFTIIEIFHCIIDLIGFAFSK